MFWGDLKGHNPQLCQPLPRAGDDQGDEPWRPLIHCCLKNLKWFGFVESLTKNNSLFRNKWTQKRNKNQTIRNKQPEIELNGRFVKEYWNLWKWNGKTLRHNIVSEQNDKISEPMKIKSELTVIIFDGSDNHKEILDNL